MEYNEKWLEIFSTINVDGESNIIEKIKEGLKEKDEGEYKEWEEASFNVNYKFRCGSCKPTLLHFAAEHSCKDVVNALIDGGADINATDEQRGAPLHLAAQGGRTEIVSALIDRGADINATVGILTATPLYWAIIYNKIDIVKVLIDKGADINATDGQGSAPLHLAAGGGNTGIVSALVKVEGININAEDKDGNTPLHLAISQNKKDVVELLLKVEKINVNAEDKDESTPLHWAARGGNTEIVNALIERGAKVNAEDKDESTPLHWAVRGGSTEIVNALIKAKADVNAEDKDGSTPLHWAVRGGSTEIVNALIKAKADVNAKDGRGRTPLRLAIQHGSEQAAKLLIAHKVKLNPRAQKPEYLVQHDSNFTREMSEYWDECLKEVQEVKQEGIGNNITLYDILRDNDANKLISYVQSKKMVQMSEEGSCRNKFPIYGGEMVTKRFGNFHDGYRMRKEGPFNLKIAEYLSNEDIESLRKADQTIGGKKGSQKASTSQQSAQAAVDDRPSSSLSISSLSSNDRCYQSNQKRSQCR